MTADRCVATNPAGARCLWPADHWPGNFHFFADDRDRYAYYYGHLAATVEAFLGGLCDREHLAQALAEAQSALAETASVAS